MAKSRVLRADGNAAGIWRARAVCRPELGHDPELWFPPEPRPYATRKESRAQRLRRIQQEEAAKALCATCPVRLDCLTWSADNDMREGVWGGLTATERGMSPLR